MNLKELDEDKNLLTRAGRIINSVTKGLKDVDLETRKKIMERSGESCAIAGSLFIAQKIAENTTDLEEIIQMTNKEIPWCGSWSLKGKTIVSICAKCGCPLVRNKIVELNETFCFCSLGWVKKIFSVLLKKTVDAELKNSIGRGDKVCSFVVHI